MGLINKNDKIKSIDIVFENCEVATIPAKYISWISLGGITQNIHSFNMEDLRIEDTLLANRVDITINKNIKDVDVKGTFFDDRDIVDRIGDGDITWIDLIIGDRSKGENISTERELNIAVPWNENDDQYNHYQKLEEHPDYIDIIISKEEDHKCR